MNFKTQRMFQLNIGIIIVFLTLVASKDSRRCYLDRVHKMIAYNCANLRLTEIPKYIRASTEILDASENRIKKLKRNSFTLYPDLKFLYLFDNMILKIEAGTFSHLTLLEALDLSQNGLRIVPPEIFNLPNLRKLYLSDNELKDEGFSSITKPVKAPLIYLNIAATEIAKIPDFGILPELLVFNISMNSLLQISPEQFAPLCQIQQVDLNHPNVGDCDCHKINKFLVSELQRLPILSCRALPLNCHIELNSTSSETKDYVKCLNIKEELIKTRNSDAEVTWPLVVFCSIIGVLFCIMIYVHCRQNPQKRTRPIELSEDFDLPVNPESRSTLIM